MEQTYLSKRYNYLNARIAQKNRLIHKLRQEVDYWRSEHRKIQKKIQPVENEINKSTRNAAYKIIIDRVINAIRTEYPNFNEQIYTTRSRVREICIQRQLFQYLLIKKGLTTTFTGQITCRDHSTTLAACRTVTDLMDTDKSFNNIVKRIVERLEKHDL